MNTVEERHGSSSFYSLYDTIQTIIMLINQTIMVYIEDSISWTIGYVILTLFMLISITVFFADIYVADLYVVVDMK